MDGPDNADEKRGAAYELPQARYGKDSALRIHAAKGALRAEGEHSAA